MTGRNTPPLWFSLAAAASLLLGGGAAAAKSRDDVIDVPAFSLPDSPLLSAASRAAIQNARMRDRTEKNPAAACPSLQGAAAGEVKAIRRCQVDRFPQSYFYRFMSQYHPTKMHVEHIGGVYTQVFLPLDGIDPRNVHRVLINLHGGSFVMGERWISVLESAPIASVGRIKVVSVDYREAPEHVFPAASEDVAAVYRELLKSHKPQDIGIFGCSAGALLTAEATAWFAKVGLPRPGAIAMLCEGASYWLAGDSPYFTGKAAQPTTDNPYFARVDPNDPLAFPGASPATLAKFPPSLLVSGTRDFGLSSVAKTHSSLVALGVPAELHVWEGMDHAFFYRPEIPESQEVYRVVVDFFARRLGTEAP